MRRRLLRMVETCDLVVAGRDAEFHLEPGEGITPLVEHIVTKGSRPVVMSGPEWVASRPVPVACDGSAPAATALQIAVLLGIPGSDKVHILSISRDRSEATAVPSEPRAFLAVHGVVADLAAIQSSDHPADVLPRRASEARARMLMMGAFGHRGFREILFGSTTRRLFDKVPLPLFIHH